MTRSKRKRLRRIALGLAVAAVVTPATAQARPLDVSGEDSRLIHDLSIPDAGSEDAAPSRQDAASLSVVQAHSRDGYDAGTGTVGGVVLILGAAGAAAAVNRSRKGKPSTA